MTIKTLRANNGSFANLGSITVQPLVKSLVTNATNQLVMTHPSSVGVLPTRQTTLDNPVLLPGSVLSRFATPTLSEIGHHLTFGDGLVIPLPNKFNTVMPTYHLNLDSGKEYDPRQNQGFTTTATKFQPYEQLTGISQERPEVIMVTGFEPMFDRDVIHTAPNFITALNDAGLDPYMTDAGRFFDTQMHIRNLRSFNVQSFIRTLTTRFTNINRMFTTRTSNFQQALNQLNTDASFLLNLVRILEAQKEQLDLRHDIWTVDPNQVGSLTTANFVQQQQTARPIPDTQKQLSSISMVSRHPPRYDFVDVLTSLGYKEDTVKTIYSSSKVWMQTLLELSYALKYHTLQFLDIDPSYERNDTNPSTILNPKVTRFSLSTNLPNLPPLSELINLQPSLAAQTINTIKPAFTTIYQNVSFKDEEARIAALAHLVSYEYKYSYGLTLPSMVLVLNDYYNYSLATGTGNSTLFDSIIGKFGNNITDFPSQGSSALTSISQQVQGDQGILSFESKYVEGDTGTLSPGGEFFFDQVLQTNGKTFNTTNIDAFTTVLDNALNAFNIVNDNLNLMSRPNANITLLDQVLNGAGSVLDTPGDLLNVIKTQLVGPNGNTSKMLNDDRLAGVFAYARQDNGVKSALFLYCLAKISRSYNTIIPFFTSDVNGDNTPLVNTLITQVNTALSTALPITRSAVQYLSEPGADITNVNSPSALTPSAVQNALLAGTPLTTFIFTLMAQVLAQFQVFSQAIKNSFTQYSGYLDTIVMMVVFDLIISAIARYGSIKLIGQATSGFNASDQTTSSYVASQTSIHHKNSINELMERVAAEDTRVQQMILTIINALTVLSGSLKNVTNYLKSPTSTQTLQTIAGILGNNQQMIRMLFSEQQIMLLASTVSNLLTATGQGLSTQQPTFKDTTNDNQETQILDESEVPSAMRDALFGYFGTADFAAEKGVNKRILTVGIPQGFTQRIKQKVNIQDQQRASFQNRRNDIVQICVYKVDIVNSDIVYKPLRYLFEMSRFPVRVSTVPWLPLPPHPHTTDIVNSIPTLNFSQNADTSTSTSITQGIEYASAVIADNDGIKSARAALDDESYSFLTTNQKAKLLQNHVVSQLLESYIKVMTGINVAEYTFDMADVPPPMEADFTKTVTEHSVAHISDMLAAKASAPSVFAQSSNALAGGVMFSTTGIDPPAFPQGSYSSWAISQPQLSNPAGVVGLSSLSTQMRAIPVGSPLTKTLEQTAINGNLDTSLATATPKSVPLMLENFRTISSLSYTLCTASDPAALNQKVVTPKQFDRVFNVIIDPTEFEIDVTKTTETPYGRNAFNLMIQHGEIVPANENDIAESSLVSVSTNPITPGSRPFAARPAVMLPTANGNTLQTGHFQYRDRDITQGDVIADKYFITVETIDEGT
jgi:hypothetical protein